MSEDRTVAYAVDQQVATVTLNKPDRLNAYSAVMAADLRDAMSRAAADPAVRVIVLTGAGRGFCAGADMESLSAGISLSAPSTDETEFNRRLESRLGPPVADYFEAAKQFGYFARIKKPVIAAINGAAAGIGLVMTLYADVRFAAEGAVFTTSFSKRGLVGEHGLSWLLPRVVGFPAALEITLSSRKFDAGEAERLGLVSKVFSAASFRDDVMAYAQTLATTVSPRSMAVIKAQFWKAAFQDLNASIETALREVQLSLEDPDFKEGVAHFLERRPPRFSDI